MLNKQEECLICMNDNETIFVTLHNNENHRLCKTCYKSLSVHFCPFCRCRIVLEKEKYFNQPNTELVERNVYPFLLHPEIHEPSGTCNLARLFNRTFTLGHM